MTTYCRNQMVQWLFDCETRRRELLGCISTKEVHILWIVVDNDPSHTARRGLKKSLLTAIDLLIINYTLSFSTWNIDMFFCRNGDKVCISMAHLNIYPVIPRLFGLWRRSQINVY